jgi:hypothetical protein
MHEKYVFSSAFMSQCDIVLSGQKLLSFRIFRAFGESAHLFVSITRRFGLTRAG